MLLRALDQSVYELAMSLSSREWQEAERRAQRYREMLITSLQRVHWSVTLLRVWTHKHRPPTRARASGTSMHDSLVWVAGSPFLVIHAFVNHQTCPLRHLTHVPIRIVEVCVPHP